MSYKYLKDIGQNIARLGLDGRRIHGNELCSSVCFCISGAVKSCTSRAVPFDGAASILRPAPRAGTHAGKFIGDFGRAVLARKIRQMYAFWY